MSKPMSRRIAVAVLLGLIIVLGVFITAQAAAVNTGSVGARADVTAGDSYYASQQRGVTQSLSPFSSDFHKGGRGCEGENWVDAQDY